MRKQSTDFYTVMKSEAGIKVPLLNPDGSESSEWLLIIGPDSKRFRKAGAELSRGIADLKSSLPLPKDGEPDPDAELRDALDTELVIEYAGKLVLGWSFEDAFTPESLRALLDNSPSIRQAIPNVSTDRSRFFGLDSPASSPGPTSGDDSQAQVTDISEAQTLKERKSA
jgi:hypothetical protein